MAIHSTPGDHAPIPWGWTSTSRREHDTMPAFKINRRDLDFTLYEQFQMEAHCARFPAYDGIGREDLDLVMDSAIRFCTDELAPLASQADREGCRLEGGKVYVPASYEKVYKAFCKGGWVAVSQNPEYGGMGLPKPMGIIMSEIGIGAGSSFMFYPGLTVSAGHLIENFASKELAQLLVPRLYSGHWTGTMCLTEPHAGTNVGDIKTAAAPMDDQDREFRIKGNKIFISAGDHQLTENIIHLVLARVQGDPEGIKGISLFAVPRQRFDATGALLGDNDVAVTGIEHKMGINASATCALSFGDNGDCRGYLIGERCKGIVYMFQMMNEARVVCGVQGVALGAAAYELALDYAKGRTQGPRLTDRSQNPATVAIIEHPDVRRNLMIGRAYIEGCRALLLRTAFLADIAHNTTDEAEKTKCADLVDLLTPICKAYSTDRGFDVTNLAIQIHGGYGYIKEYGVEQHMRDLKIASIYEGTNGIQALDLLGRKMRLKHGGLFLTWLQDTNHLLQSLAPQEALADITKAVDDAKNKLCEVAFGFSTVAKQDPERSLLGATPFLELFGHVEIARLLLEQASIAAPKLAALQGDGDLGELLDRSPDARFYDGKIKTARFFAHHLLPQVYALAHSITSTDRSALDIRL
jgi:alkylation response protein AidB-like acyl-CoA dehydrogenase